MSSTDQTKAITTLLKSLGGVYTPEPEPERTPIDQLVFSYLLWESSATRAENAMKRLEDAFVDVNELRVSRTAEIMAVLGKTYPRAEDRVLRMKASLRDLFCREHAVTLEGAQRLSKRDGRKYVESLEGIPPFVAARICLLSLGSHAIPIEERLVARLAAAGVLPEDTDVARAASIFDRTVKAAEGREAAALLQALAEDASADIESLAGARGKRSPRTSKKSTASKTGAKGGKSSASKKKSTKKTSAKRSAARSR